MFPLKQRKIGGYTFGVPTWYNSFHIGCDYSAKYVELYAPFDGTVRNGKGDEAGNFITFKPDHDNVEMRFLHLSKFIKSGRVKEGELIAITGNTGNSSEPHLHLDISKNKVDLNNIKNFIDPEKYNWNLLKTTFMKITVVANNNNWTTLPEQVTKLAEMFKTYSSGRLEIVADIRKTSFTDIPLAPLAGAQAIDVNWYRQNVSPLATGQLTVFTMNPEDYHNGTTWGFMSYGDPNKPVRCEISPVENLPDQYGTPHFAKQAFHEICHALLFLTGQTDRVHELIYQDPPGYKAILDLIDYQKLQEALIKIKGDSMSQAKVVKSKNSPTVYICYPVPSATHLNERASLEGIQIPNPIPNSDSL